MSKQGKSILKGLNEILEYTKGDTSKCIVRTVEYYRFVPIKEYTREEIQRIRKENNMSQETFAELMAVTTKTVESWESGKHKPKKTARRIFQLIEKDKTILDKLITRN